MKTKPQFTARTRLIATTWSIRLPAIIIAITASPGGMIAAQPAAAPPAKLVGNWIAQDGPSLTRFDLQPNGRFLFLRQSQGRSQASMGLCRVTADTIELQPGSEGAKRLKYSLSDSTTLRLTEPDGTVLVLARSQQSDGGSTFSASAPGSSASVTVIEGGANRSTFPWTNMPGMPPPPFGQSPPAFEPRPPNSATMPSPAPGSIPTPEWQARALSNRPSFPNQTIRQLSTNMRADVVPAIPPPASDRPARRATPATPSGIGLSAEDLAMANAAIAENTLTLRLPGLGTSVDGPGPLTAADRLVLFALKLHQQRNAQVPFGEMRAQVERSEPILRNRRVVEEFWAWYREAALEDGQKALGGYKDAFSTYLIMKTTAKRKAANSRIRGPVESDAAWRRAMDSDRQFRDNIAQRADAARTARERTLQEWNVQALEAAAAQKEWELYLTHGAGHMNDN